MCSGNNRIAVYRAIRERDIRKYIKLQFLAIHRVLVRISLEYSRVRNLKNNSQILPWKYLQ